MSFKIISNKGRLTNFNYPVMLCKDAAGNTFLAGFWRENGALVFRYFRKSEFLEVTPIGSNYVGVGYYKTDLTVDPAVVASLSCTGDPDGVALSYQAGKVSDYFPEITNMQWSPQSGTIDSITVTSINGSGSGSGNGSGSGSGTNLVFELTANGDGTITITGINIGDAISVDGGTIVKATDTTYTTAKQADGTHTVVVTSGTAGYSYGVSSKTVTTKIALLSAPLDWVTQNPAYAVAILIAFVLFIWKVAIPVMHGEPIFGSEGKTAKKSISSKKRFISLT